MPKYNIYKLIKNKQIDLVCKLNSVGLELQFENEINGMLFSFYVGSDDVDIWWTDTYRHFFSPNQTDVPKNKTYAAALIISTDVLCYGISLGKTHFYLKKYCDAEFGLQLAERIVDEKNMKIKNSKFYKTQKNKSITTYQDGSELDFDSGEAMHFIKAKTINENVWGKVASFGNSVQFNLEQIPQNLTELILQIENKLQEEPILDIPKADQVKNTEKCLELDNLLTEKILSVNEGAQVSVDEFFVSGINFVFTDEFQFQFLLNRVSSEIGDLSMSRLLSFLNDNGFDLHDNINNISVKVIREHGRDYTEKLKFFIDFVEETERYCLIDGKWYQFNQAYTKFLEKEVDNINFNYEPQFDLVAARQSYVEANFNADRVNDGYVNYDRDLESIDGKYRVEKMDLYKDNTLYFVKIGNAQKLNYVIDQAILSVKVLQNNESKIIINGEEKEIRQICIWVIYERMTNIDRLSDVNSLIFHMKLVDWAKTVRNAGYQPILKWNYKR